MEGFLGCGCETARYRSVLEKIGRYRVFARPSFVVFAITPGRRKALTGEARGTYHGGMKRQLSPRISVASRILQSVFLGGLVACLACGCEDAARQPVGARVPVAAPYRAPDPAPTAAAQQQISANLAQKLPLVNPAARPSASLLPPATAGKAYLMARVEEKFVSGEQNYKAGHLEASRKD